MIRIKAMPTVAPAFLKGLIFIAQERLKYFMNYPITARYAHDYKAINRATVIKYLVPVARAERSSLDLLLTRLRKLDYVSYEFDNCGSSNMMDGKFVCKTVPLIMTDMIDHTMARRRRGVLPTTPIVTSWDIGDYIVSVPVYGVLNAALDTFKMRPNRDDVRENVYYHPHHHYEHTCWSQWLNPLTEGCRNCDFDLLFGAFIGFLRNYNSSSPLRQPPFIDWTMDHDREMFWMKPIRSTQ